MSKCAFCQKEVIYPFKCSFCGSNFCTEHRLPESHDCPNQPARTPLGQWKPTSTVTEMPKVSEIKKPRRVRKRVKEEGKFYFIKGEDSGKRRIPTKKIIAIALLVIVLAVVLWNFSTIVSFFQTYLSQSPRRLHSHSETFDLPVGSILTSVPITRSVELEKEHIFKGNFTITGLPELEAWESYSLGVAILDPVDEVVSIFTNKTESTFHVTASYNGVYKMRFAFVYSGTRIDQISSPLVTFKYEIIG